MKRIVFFIAVLLSILLIACQNKSNQPSTSMNNTTMHKDTSKIAQDTSFLDGTAEGDMMMVQLGKIAQQKTHSKAIKEFGQMMITDHSKVNDKLDTLAQQNNLTLPDNLSKDKQEEIHDLSKLSWKKFDKKYVDMMVSDHQNAVNKFKEESQNAASPQVRKWAAQTLPTLQKHLDKIKQIQKKYHF